MGRGGQDFPEMTGRAGADGEIPLLDADRLDDHVDAVARDAGAAGRFGDDADGRAANRLFERLRRTPTGQRLSEEELEDHALELYRRACDLITSGRADEAQLRKTAAMFGEDPEELKLRLGVAEPQEDEQPAGDGAAQLLGAIFGGKS